MIAFEPVHQSERLAMLRRAIEAKGTRAAVLQEVGISPSEWVALQREVLATISRELSEGRRELAERYLAAWHGSGPAVGSAPLTVGPDETLPVPMKQLELPVLPFGAALAGPSAATPAMKPRPRPPDRDQSGETVLTPVIALVPGRSGTFRDALAPQVAPILSIQEYADLRARLTIYGENHRPTLERYRVIDREVREALQTRFSAYFSREPKAQAEFLELIRAAIPAVRAERDRGT